MATVTNPGSFMATITHPTGNGYCHRRTKGITYSEARSLMAAKSSPGDSLWQP